MNDEEIESKIRQFIKQYPGRTINQVTEYLSNKRILSYVPARNKVISLIQNEIIEDRKKGNSFHRLFINDKNDFNLIDNQLTEIEDVYNHIHEVLSISKSSENGDSLTTSEIHDSLKVLDFADACNQYLLLMLRFLLVETSNRIKSQNHSQIIYNRIVKLMIKFDHVLTEDPRLSRRIFKHFINRDLHLIENKFKTYIKKWHVDDAPLNNLRRLSENFEQNILD